MLAMARSRGNGSVAVLVYTFQDPNRHDIDLCFVERLERVTALDAVTDLARRDEVVCVVVLAVRERDEVIPVHLQENETTPPFDR